MAINRTRHCSLTPDGGYGYHVRDKIAPSGEPE